MIYAALAFVVILIVYGPFLWVKFVLWRHSKTITAMPGTGGELAQHLIDRFELPGVTVTQGDSDHYNPEQKVVSLSKDVYTGKSLTAVAVAAHEIGHAIQFSKEEPISKLREKYLKRIFHIRRAGSMLLLVMTAISAIIKLPHMFLATALLGIITMLASVLMYVAILPEEYDASFNKALPLLGEGYVPSDKLPAVRQILLACALTYVAGALTDIINLWRWIRFLR